MVVALKTLGALPIPEDPRLNAREWSIEDNADPRTGEVTFPLIAAGRHLFYIRYTDETPGRYDGDLTIDSEISHLARGDTFERTVYVSTFAVDVAGE